MIDDDRALRRADFPVLREVPTRWSDVDAYGHVNNVVHYAVFDTVVNAWLIEASGTDVRRLPAVGLVVETSCRYLAELGFPEPSTAGLRLERRGTTSVVYRLALFGPGSESPAATGASCTCTSTSRPAVRCRRRSRCSGRWRAWRASRAAARRAGTAGPSAG